MPASCGTTTFAREFIAQHMGTAAMICASRQRAADFREQLWRSVLESNRDATSDANANEGTETAYLTKPNVFTISSLAFYLLQNVTLSEEDGEGTSLDDETSFQLITGAGQMSLIDECIDSYLNDAANQTVVSSAPSGGASGVASGMNSKGAEDSYSKALQVGAFKQELREFFEMMQDHGIDSADVKDLATSEGIPLLSIATTLLESYLEKLDDLHSYDHISLLNHARESLSTAQVDNNFEAGDFDAEYLFVDNAQDLTLSGLELLKRLAKVHSTKVILLFNEYLTSNGFRGSLGVNLYQHIPAKNTHFFAGYTQRTAMQSMIGKRVEEMGENVRALEASSTLEQTLYVANQIRQGYLDQVDAEAASLLESLGEEQKKHGNFQTDSTERGSFTSALPKYSDYAIIAHSQSSFEEIAHGLRSQNIPVQGATNSKALRDEPLWISFEAFLKLSLTKDDDTTPSLIRNASLSLVESLRRHYGAHYGVQSGRDQELESFASELRNLVANNTPMPSVLWSIWERSGAANALQNEAIKGVQPDFANHHLDVSLQIFSLAEAYYLEHTAQKDGDPCAMSTRTLIDGFISYIDSLPVAVDNIHAAKNADAVQLLTPTNAIGMHFKQVFCIDFNESSWPNTRLRDSILHTSIIPQVIVARASREPLQISTFSEAVRRRANLHNELCLLYIALTRSERVQFIAVESPESTASSFLKLLPESSSISGLSHPALTLNDMQKQLSFEALELALSGEKEPHELEQSESVQLLGQLTALDSKSGSLQNWHYADHMPSQEEPFGNEEMLYLGPSTLEKLLECPMQWFLEKAGGTPMQSGQSAMVGTVVHKVLQILPELVGTREETVQEMHRVYNDLQQGKVKLGEDEHPEDFILSFDTKFDEQMNTIRVNRYFENAAGYYEYIADRANMLKYRQIQNTELHVEKNVEIAPKTKLHGVIDRVEVNSDQRLFVVDWKTSTNSWHPSENVPLNMQLLAYQKLLDPESAGKTAGGALVYLGKETKGDASKSLVDQEGIDALSIQANELFETAAKNARGSEYIASLNDKCRFCNLKTSCPLQDEGGAL
ncbi:MAG: PD-(D/E)XK nuclease family protein [Candidatus Ancillula sp.]|jgi:superfamily I DNA/RNA helicase|nr:PD-(D/E)XK nuclease family protein [Candidatus Ancillula sp.]